MQVSDRAGKPVQYVFYTKAIQYTIQSSWKAEGRHTHSDLRRAPDHDTVNSRVVLYEPIYPDADMFKRFSIEVPRSPTRFQGNSGIHLK